MAYTEWVYGQDPYRLLPTILYEGLQDQVLAETHVKRSKSLSDFGEFKPGRIIPIGAPNRPYSIDRKFDDRFKSKERPPASYLPREMSGFLTPVSVPFSPGYTSKAQMGEPANKFGFRTSYSRYNRPEYDYCDYNLNSAAERAKMWNARLPEINTTSDCPKVRKFHRDLLELRAERAVPHGFKMRNYGGFHGESCGIDSEWEWRYTGIPRLGPAGRPSYWALV